ncbi:hypothetical protein BJ170DRAFT_639718 [Xylariales sp. AK1849]|nr:hypothetical protein BJ170DRAFT_639718 [Xylariales sp. AK1849]
MLKLLLRTTARRRTPLQLRLSHSSRRFQSTESSSSSSLKATKNEASVAAPVTAASTRSQRALAPFTRAAQGYNRAHKKRPYITQVVSSMVIFLGADIAAQTIDGKGRDPWRTLRTVFTGALFAPFAYKWQVTISSYFNYTFSRLPSILSRAVSAVPKVAITTFAYAPIVSTYFFAMQAGLTGHGPEEMWERVKAKVPAAWVTGLYIWPAVMFVNFIWVPLIYRSLVGGAVGLGWQTYLSWMNKQAELEEAKRKDVTPIVPTKALDRLAQAV